VGRFVALIALVVLIDGCRLGPTATPSPLPSPTPHTAVAMAVLQQPDVPAGLQQCPGSGEIATYLAGLDQASTSLAPKVKAQWQALKAEGATSAAISILTADPAACAAELGAGGTARSAASFVVAFGDDGQADRAWQAGVLGFAPPLPGEVPPGIARGTATGLGASSWTYDRAPVRLASWRKSVFVALVVFANLDPAAFKAATAAVDAHLN
jgi:hypothetical protein